MSGHAAICRRCRRTVGRDRPAVGSRAVGRVRREAGARPVCPARSEFGDHPPDHDPNRPRRTDKAAPSRRQHDQRAPPSSLTAATKLQLTGWTASLARYRGVARRRPARVRDPRRHAVGQRARLADPQSDARVPVVAVLPCGRPAGCREGIGKIDKRDEAGELLTSRGDPDLPLSARGVCGASA
jgi:hypothetical protein